MTDSIRTALANAEPAPTGKDPLQVAPPEPTETVMVDLGGGLLMGVQVASTTEDSSATTPPAEGTHGPSIEELGPLIAWLNEEAGQAANADAPYAAGMLRWAAEIVSERVDEDAPDPATPPAEGKPGNSKTRTITVQTPSFEEMRDWILREGQFSPCGTELLQCLMLMTPPAKAEPAQPAGEEENK